MDSYSPRLTQIVDKEDQENRSRPSSDLGQRRRLNGQAARKHRTLASQRWRGRVRSPGHSRRSIPAGSGRSPWSEPSEDAAFNEADATMA